MIYNDCSKPDSNIVFMEEEINKYINENGLEISIEKETSEYLSEYLFEIYFED